MSARYLLRSLALALLVTTGTGSVALAATKTWTGAINNLWSNPGNWAGGVPVAGDRIAFPVSASNTTNTNDLAPSTVFFDITFLGSNYIVNGNTIGLSDGIPANNGTNNRINADLLLTQNQSLQGSFCCSGLTLAGNIAIGANAITISGATVNGVISGTGTVTSGDVTVFAGNNTYNGLTTIVGRTEINGSQPGSSVQVGPSGLAWLSGQGTAGAVTLTGSSSQITPGTGFGGNTAILNTGALNFGASTSYLCQLNGAVAGTTYDQVAVTGSVTIGANVTLSLILGYSPSNGQVLRLIDNDGVDPVSGTFSGMPEGQIVTMNASDFQISYVGGDGNDVTLTVVAAAKTWTGAVNALWSVAGNWQGGVPGPGDPLVFPNGASNLTNTNDLPATNVYKLILFTGNGYVLNGNTIQLTNGIPQGNASNNRVNADLVATQPQTLGGAFCCAGLTLGNVAIGGNAVTIVGATVNGVISGTGPVTSGDVTVFAGNNTYTNGTTVTGRLEVNGNQPASAITVGPSGLPWLSGSGTTGAVTTTGSSSQITPGIGFGGATGILSTGALNFGSSSSYLCQLNGTTAGTGYDQLAVTGTVTIGANVTLSLILGYSPSNGQVLRLIDNDGVDPVSGTFSGMPEGQIVTMNASDFQISYVGGDGNDVTLTVTAAAKTWTGAVNALWSVAGNWQGGVPGPGDPLVFPNGASNLTNTNDLPATNVYKQILFTGNSYILNGNTIQLTGGIPQGNGTNNRVNADLVATAPQTLGGAFCCAGLTLGNVAIGSNAVTIVGATVNGVITGSGPLTAGDVTVFNGNNTYNGATTVTGRWEVNGVQPSSNVTVGPSGLAWLSGNGTTGTVTTTGFSSQVTPGTGFGGAPGKLNIGDLSLGANSAYIVQLNGPLPGTSYDQLNVTGTIGIAGGVSLNVVLGFTPALGQVFVIGQNDAADAVSGIFNGLPQNATFNLGPYPFEISYIGKTGNDIILTSLSGDSLNSAPIALPDTFVVAQNTGLSVNAPGVMLNDSDPDLDPITVVSAPSTTTKGGLLTVNADGSFTYSPPVGFVGFDDFTYIISDGNNATDLAQVIIEVQDNVPPSVTVIAPNGGEVLIVGTNTLLDWTIADKKPITGVDLYISRDNGSTYQAIALNIPNSPPFNWLVTPPPTNTGPSPVFSALFKVVARDSSGNQGLDVSDGPFAIHDAVTGTTLSLLQLTPADEGIELRWRLGDPAQFTSVAIERAESAAGPWSEVALSRHDEASVTVAVDRMVESEKIYFYRLTGTTTQGESVRLGQISGSAHLVIREFALSRIVPNPSRAVTRIEYALPHESHVRLSVLDVQGREVVVLADGVFGAGRYQATWSGQTDRGEAPAGLYFVRCAALGQHRTERLIRTK
jgi:hypothetical protein